MFSRKVVAIGLCLIILASASYRFSAQSQERQPTVPHFWLVTSNEINSSLGPFLENYVNDVTNVLQRTYPTIIVEKQAITLSPTASSNQQAQTVVTLLENAFHEQNLIGAFVVGMPLPEVEIAGKKMRSTLPYGDFENKVFVFSQHTDLFSAVTTPSHTNKHSDIMLGYLPDLGTEGLTTYFNAHHNYFAGTLGYNRALFYNDQAGDFKLRESLGSGVLSPVKTTAFEPTSYLSALKSGDTIWTETLAGTKRWQPGISLTANEATTFLDGWYNEPAIETLRNLLPAIAKDFLALPTSTDTGIIQQQENTMGELLSNLGAFSSPVAIRQRFFASNNLSPEDSDICEVTDPLPNPDTDEFRLFRTQFNALQAWISSVPRGSLLAKAPTEATILVNGARVGQYFFIRPGDFVGTASSEPITLKTLLIDPSVISADLEIPRTGFNHPGVTATEVPSWTIIDITNDQINELIGWHYFFTTMDHYRYFVKNRLPALNQYVSAPNSFEVVVNVVTQKLANSFTDNCLTNRNPNTRSLLTIFSGYNALDDNDLALNELSTGKSLAVIVTNTDKQSATPSFDYMSTVPFAGLANPPLLTSFAGGTPLGKSIQSGSNEHVALLGDPCLTLPQ